MKKIIYIFITVLLSNCAIYKPDSSSISTPDYNKRVNVSNAHFDKVLTTAGVSSFVVGTAAGAYLGYSMTEGSDYFASYNGTEKNNYSVAGGVVGGFVGFSVTYLANKALGWGSYKTPSNPQEWIKKANKKFLLVRQENNSDFTLMHSSAESNFTVKNINDARDFASAFTAKSSFADKLVQQGGLVVNRNEIPEFINLYKNSSKIRDVKFRYLSLSSTVSECIDAKDRYSIVTAESEKEASKLIVNLDDVRLFKSNFPQSTYMNSVLALAISKISTDQLPTLINLFPKSSYPNLSALAVAEKKYVDNSSSLSSFLSSTNKYSKVYSKAEIEKKSANLVRNYSDAKTFKNKFGASSTYSKSVFKNAQRDIVRKKIPYLIKLYSNLDSFTIVRARKLYIEKSTTIAECYKAGISYLPLKNIADKKASTLVNDINSCNSYFSYFTYGDNTYAVKNKLATYLKREYRSVSTLLDKQKFINKYRNLRYDPSNIVSNVVESLNSANRSAEYNYQRALDYSDANDQMVMIVYKTSSSYPAFLVLEDVKQSCFVVDFMNPWVDYIYVAGARGNEGVIMGKWYKKGTQSDFWGSAANGNREVNLFVGKAGGLAKRIESVISFDAIYLGSHASDDYSTASSYSYDDEPQGSFSYEEEDWDEDFFGNDKDKRIKGVCSDGDTWSWNIRYISDREREPYKVYTPLFEFDKYFSSEYEAKSYIIKRAKKDCD